MIVAALDTFARCRRVFGTWGPWPMPSDPNPFPRIRLWVWRR